MFCPECQGEYREGFTRCADCDVDLVASLPAAGAGDRMVTLWRGLDPVFHSALTAALAAAEIPHLGGTRHDYLSALSGREKLTFSIGVAPCEVWVPASVLDEARKILQELLDIPPAAPEV